MTMKAVKAKPKLDGQPVLPTLKVGSQSTHTNKKR